MYTERATEKMEPLAIMPPDDHGPGTHNSAYLSTSKHSRHLLVLDVGDCAAGATIDAGIQQASDSAGTGVKAISGKTITQLAQADGDTPAKVAIELRGEELDVNGSYVRFYVTTAGATVIFGATLYGVEPKTKPVDTANWDEIVD